MHIQEIVVDGFKSYAHRTVIAGFDPHFNAITGLNGSGKSNILDSICFVLGITNLSHVRAGNLSELVYKQGQAGINKASVTIVFNNNDPNSSPVGYEHCPEVTVTRQVLIGGASKYLINGKVSRANIVANLFHSVQLNVNNPHFLIMQGRITKVLNMKPHEILGMVEEAAGTRMYENKKVAAIKTIEKKQKKVDEINTVLSEEITPTLERLRGEKQHYLKWSKNNADIERIERFVVASDYMKSQQVLKKNEDEVSTMESELQANQDQIQKHKDDILQKDQEIEMISTQLNGEYSGALKAAKTEESDVSKELVKLTSAWKSSQKDVIKAQEDLDAARALVVETKEAVNAKEAEIAMDATNIEGAKKAVQEAEKELERLTTEYQNMCAGISSEESGDGMTLPDQISKAHNDASSADAKAKQALMKMKHLQKSIKPVEKDMKKEEKSSSKLASKRDAASEKVKELKEKLETISFSPDEFSALEAEKDELEASMSQFQETVDTLTAQLEGRLSFNYSDPVKGFDRSKVKGLVAKLIHVKNSDHATALEVTAGGKLYQVVVDEAITGKALLSRGKLKRRVTIIPLDKIRSKTLTNAAVTQADAIAKKMGATASPAIELVGFDEEIRTALEYVFGATIIVNDSKAANEICDKTRTRTVTTEGDTYDPSGTISGGSKNNLGTTLASMTELASATTNLKECEAKLAIVVEAINKMKSSAKAFEDASAKLELCEAELKAVEKHLSQTSYGMLYEKFSAMKLEIEAASKEIEEMEKEKEKKWNLFNELKEKEAELTASREEKLKDIEARMTSGKKMVAQRVKEARDAETQTETLVLELESLQAEFVAAKEAVLAAEKALSHVNDVESEKQMQVGEIKARYDQVKMSLDVAEEKVQSFSKELNRLGKEKSEVEKACETIALQSKKISVQIVQIRKSRQNAEQAASALMKKYPWIETEKEAFGVPGGDYDFATTDVDGMSHQLDNLVKEQAVLSKKVNKKVMGMIEKAEGEYSELMRKRKVVENDKKKIESVIEELDVKKKSELERTWVKVNRDFGSIFSTLLPGAFAKLEPPDGLEAWEGLEVKVAFGGVWKESLSELSGGQRSLLALSLILSLLLFKPAPMYILDEVDAALDLSHTQNIGNMLKTHFSQSQFIVVSLKEGMFNNANVIFRTKFVDGVSQVTRTIGIGASNKARALAATDQNNQESTVTSKRSAGRSTQSRVGKEN